MIQQKEFFTKADKSLFNFIFKFFFKTKVGPIISQVFPIIFMIMYIIINAMKNADLPPSQRSSAYFVSGFPTYIVLSIIPLSFITLPQTMVELKNSILLRKIKTSGFTKTRYLTFTYIQYFFFSIVSVTITLIIYLSLLNVGVAKDMDNVNWGNLIYAIIMLILSSNAFGIMLGSIFKSAMVTQLFGVCMLFIVMAFGGLFMPVSVIGDVMPIKIVSMFLPTNYSINLIMNCTFVSPQWYLDSMKNFIWYGNVIQEIANLDPKLSEFLSFSNEHGWTQESINATNLGFDMFDIDHPLYYIESSYNFGFLNPQSSGASTIDTENPKRIAITLNTVEVFPTWQKVLNLVMAPVCTIGMSLVAYFRFSWYGR